MADNQQSFSVLLGLLLKKVSKFGRIFKSLLGLLSLVSRYKTKPGLKKLSFVRSGYTNSFVRTIKKAIFKL